MTSRIMPAPVVALALLALAAVQRAEAQPRPSFDPAATYRIDVGGAPERGPRDAPVTIVEFSDFYCPACRRAFEIVTHLMHLFPDDIRLVYRHSLLDPELGTLVAEAAEAAAAQGRFWAFHDRAFAGGGVDPATLERYARDVGMDIGRFREALADRRHRPAVRAADRHASAIGIRSTPMFFVNGRPVSGAQPLAVFLALIEEERARAAGLVASGVPPAEVYERIVAGGEPHATVLVPGTDMPRYPELHPLRPVPAGLGLPSHRRGSEDALVTIVEYSDFDCVYCERSRPTLARLEQEFGDRVRFVYRHFPVGGHGDSKPVAEAAVAAGAQGRFWEFHDQVFAARRPLDRPGLERIARDLGLDLARFRAELDQRSHFQTVALDAAEGRAFGVRGTPTFVINGLPIQGAMPYEQLRAIVLAKLADVEELLAAGVGRAELYERASAPLPAGAELEMKETDHHISVLLACLAGQADRAREHVARLASPARRAGVRAECKQRGVALD